MEDNDLDKMLGSYKVADAGAELRERIVAAAKAQPANENTRAVWLRHGALLAMAAVLGFWLGNATIPVQHVAKTAPTVTNTTTSTTGQDYLERMIMGPGSLQDMRL